MTIKIFNNFAVGRREIVYYMVILISCLLVLWQLYSGNHINVIYQTRNNQKLETSLSNPLPLALKHVRDENSFTNRSEICVSATLSLVDTSTVSLLAIASQQQEFYQVIERFSAEDKLLQTNTTFKRILFWNEVNNINAVKKAENPHSLIIRIKANKNKNYGVGHGRNILKQLGCPVWQCETSANRTDVHSYDAVLFHLRTWSKNDLPQSRLVHQRYVFWSMESAAWRIFNISVTPMNGFFNWTMTYRWDSDVVAPYGYIRPLGKAQLHPSDSQMKCYFSNNGGIKNYAKGKTKMAVWFVSNCRTVVSSRNELVKELQKYIAIDVYGTCGNLTCPKNQDESYESTEQCRDLAATQYKFYLSLENSLCRDYVTEKYR
jgi:hypothetical protein